ncbi:MAG: hypothetical protein IJW10_02625 [Clostridia bacterium]|nr:hypothetical protein [Clostridia bacterium]
MKKLISLILILSILISLITSCENEEAPATTSSVESSSSSESSSTSDDIVSSSDELTNQEQIQPSYPVQYPELIEENYYTTIKHGAHDFGATPKSGNGFEYCIFWDYEDYESSLASNTLPIASEELFDDNIVIFISNPSYLEEYYDYYITGFKDFKYDYNSMSITATNLAKISNPKYDVLENINEIPYIPPTFVIIPKTIENGLAHFARNYDVSLKIKTESLPYNNYEVRTKVVNQAPSYDGDKLWLILNEEDYGDFVVETDIDLMKGYNGFNGKISIIHYSPYGALNSISHRYSNVHMHADGTIYMEYSRLFLEERKAPESYTPTYTLINIYADDIDFDPAKANGRLICESYDYYANLKELHQTSVYPVENKYYNQIKDEEAKETAKSQILAPLVNELIKESNDVKKSLDSDSKENLNKAIDELRKALEDTKTGENSKVSSKLSAAFDKVYLLTRIAKLKEFQKDATSYYGEIDKDLFNDKLFYDDTINDLETEGFKKQLKEIISNSSSDGSGDSNGSENSNGSGNSNGDNDNSNENEIIDEETGLTLKKAKAIVSKNDGDIKDSTAWDNGEKLAYRLIGNTTIYDAKKAEELIYKMTADNVFVMLAGYEDNDALGDDLIAQIATEDNIKDTRKKDLIKHILECVKTNLTAQKIVLEDKGHSTSQLEENLQKINDWIENFEISEKNGDEIDEILNDVLCYDCTQHDSIRSSLVNDAYNYLAELGVACY